MCPLKVTCTTTASPATTSRRCRRSSPVQRWRLPMFSAPQPRSRLYTKADIYLKCGAGALLGANYEGNGVSHLEQALVTMMPGQQVIAVPMCRVGIYLALKNIIR